MAAEVGTAYVIIRAITSQLSKDIQDGLDKGARDADIDDSSRVLGERMGESTGDEFTETWTKRSSEGIEDSAESSDMRQSIDRFSDRVGRRFGESFGDNLNENLNESIDDVEFDRDRAHQLGEEVGDETGDGFSTGYSEQRDATLNDDDITIDRPTHRRIGEEIGNETGEGWSTGYTRQRDATIRRGPNDDTLRTGASGFAARFGRAISNAFDDNQGFFNKAASGIQAAFANIPGLNWLTILGLPALQLLLPVLGALIGQAVGIIGFLTTAALGGVVALAGLAAAVGPAFLVLSSAFKVESDELDSFNERLEEFMIEWDDIALATQEPLFTGLRGALDILQDSDLIPLLAEYGEVIGGIAGTLASTAAGEITLALPEIDAILDEGAVIFQTLGETVILLIRPMFKILRAAMPIAQRFANALKGAAQRFSDFIDTTGTEGLTKTFNTWYDRLAQVGRILWNVGQAIWNVLNIGGDASVGLFDDFETFTQSWADWTGDEANRGKITLFFENAFKVAGELWGLIGDIIALIIGPMTTTEGGEGMVGFIKSIREVWLPAFVDLAGHITTAIGLIVGFVQKVWGHIESVITFFDETFGTDISGKLLPFLLTAGLVLVILSKMGLLSPILKIFGLVIRFVAGAFTLLGKALWGVITFFIANPIVLGIAAIIAALLLLYFHFQPFRDFVDEQIIDPLQRMAEEFGWIKTSLIVLGTIFLATNGLIGLFAASFLLLYFRVKPFREFIDTFIIDPLQDLWTILNALTLDNFGTVLGLMITSFLDFLLELPQKGADAFSDFIDWLIEALEGIPELIGDLGSDFIEAFTGWIADIAPRFGKGLGKLFGTIVRETIRFLIMMPVRIARALPTVAAALVRFFTQVVVPGLLALGEIILEFFSNLPSLLLTALKFVGNFIVGFFEGLWPEAVTWLRENGPQIGEAIVQLFLDLPGMIVDALGELWDAITGFFLDLWDELVGNSIIPDMIADIVDWFLSLPGLIVDALLAGLQALLDIGIEIAQSVWDGIVAGFGLVVGVADWIWDWLFENVGELAGEFLTFLEGVPGTVWDLITGAVSAVAGLVGWIWDWLWDNVGDLLGGFAAFLTGVPATIWQWIKGGLTSVANLIGWLWNWLWDTVGEIGSEFLGFLAGLPATVWGLIQDALDNVDNIIGLVGWIWDWLWNAVGEVTEGFLGFLAGLPSTVWGLIQDALANVDNIVGLAGWLWDWLWGAVGAIGEDAIEFFKSIGSRILGLVKTGFIEAAKAAGSIASWLLGLGEAPEGGSSEPFFMPGPGQFFREEDARTVGTELGADIIAAAVEVFGSPETAQSIEESMQDFELQYQGTMNVPPEMIATFVANMLTDLTGEVHEVGVGDPFVEAITNEITNALADQDIDPTEMTAIVQRVVEAMTGAAENIDTAPVAQGLMSRLDKGVGTASRDHNWTSGTDVYDSFYDRVAAARDEGTPGEAESFVTSLSDSIGAVASLMVPAANKLVDMVLLTLARLHNEVKPKVVDPFFLKMIDAINDTSTESVKATNKLVDKVLFTLSRLGNEARRTMDPFILQVVDAINDTATFALTATNSLVNRVLLTMARIGNEVAGTLSSVPGTMSRVLTTAGTAAADGFEDGFKNGLASFVAYLNGLDTLILNNVGDLSNTLYNKGRELMQGMINGVKSLTGTVSVNLPIQIFHEGGIVGGTGEQLAIVQAGEAVLTVAQQAALGANVTRWQSVAASALNFAGQSQRWMLDLLTQMKAESGGNPNIINRWDSNWRKGVPSMGLMQVIMPTFLANAGKFVSRGILDPLANIFAAIIYTVRRYGDLGRWRRGGFHGYAEGGIINAPTLALLGEAGREAVIPLTRPQRALDLMRMSGLDALVTAARLPQSSGPNVTDVTMLRVDHAEIFDKVDVDIVAARIRKAYTTMVGR